MIDYKYDKLLSIKTAGDQEVNPLQPHYHPYEPTSYAALDQLFSKYRLSPDDCLVDMGCGKGRVAFYVHHLFQASAVGIEMNPSLYEDALKNKRSYIRKNRRKRGSIEFQCLLAQEYSITKHDNVFFFFNPFSVQIFMTVVQGILKSVEEFPRNVDLILYYPSNDYLFYLTNHTPFQLMDEIRLDFVYERNDNERLLIFRLG